jgi:hypothetical protein
MQFCNCIVFTSKHIHNPTFESNDNPIARPPVYAYTMSVKSTDSRAGCLQPSFFFHKTGKILLCWHVLQFTKRAPNHDDPNMCLVENEIWRMKSPKQIPGKLSSAKTAKQGDSGRVLNVKHGSKASFC